MRRILQNTLFGSSPLRVACSSPCLKASLLVKRCLQLATDYLLRGRPAVRIEGPRVEEVGVGVTNCNRNLLCSCPVVGKRTANVMYHVGGE